MNKNIVLIGLPGCGKSTIGKKLAVRLKIDFCDLDEYIEQKERLTISELFKLGEEKFRQIETAAVFEKSKSCPQIIATGGGVVLNYNNIKALQENGIIFFINRPLAQIASDLDISNRPLLQQGREQIYSLYAERIELYKNYSDFEISNSGEVEQAVAEIIGILTSRGVKR